MKVETVRVMQNNSTKRSLFEEKRLTSQPVTLTKLNRMPSGITFFNSNQESRLQDAPVISFKNTTNSPLITLKDHNSGRFTVTEKLKWTGEQEEKQVGERQGQPACVNPI